MLRFIKNVLGAGALKSTFDSTSATVPADIKTAFSEPVRRRHEIKVTRAQTKKAVKMKLERILEKTEKRR